MVGEIGESFGFNWGGRWIKEKVKNQLIKQYGEKEGKRRIQELIDRGKGWDPAHFEFMQGYSLKELRSMEKDKKGLPILPDQQDK